MKTRHFPPSKPYRIVEMRQPLSRLQEKMLDARIEFLWPCRAKQTADGFLRWNHLYIPIVRFLSGPLKGQQHTGLPTLRLRAIKHRPVCRCPGLPFPHRLRSRGCSHAPEA